MIRKNKITAQFCGKTCIQIGYLSDFGSWIFPPKKITVYTGSNLRGYEKICEQAINEHKNHDEGTKLNRVKIDCQIDNVNQLKFVVENTGICPEWHDGKGKKAWLFLDEVWVE